MPSTHKRHGARKTTKKSPGRKMARKPVKGVKKSVRPARKTAKNAKTMHGKPRRGNRPMRHKVTAKEDRMEFIELPESGSSGSSWESDSYTPKAQLAPRKPRGFMEFFGLR